MPHAVQWELINPAMRATVHVGDVVSMDAGGMPIYEIVAIDGDTALLADERRTAVRQLPLNQFRWVGRAA